MVSPKSCRLTLLATRQKQLCDEPFSHLCGKACCQCAQLFRDPACSWCHAVEQDNSRTSSNYTQLYFTCSKLSCSTVPVLYVYPWHYMEFQQGAFGILKGHFPFGFFPPFVCEVVMVTICGIWSREGTLRNLGNENKTRMNEGILFLRIYICADKPIYTFKISHIVNIYTWYIYIYYIHI